MARRIETARSLVYRTQVATITRIALSCEETCAKTNRFTVDFGQIKDADQRRIIFGAAMTWDLQFWEFKGQ